MATVVEVESLNATCTEEGFTKYQATFEGYSDTKTIAINKLSHSYGALIEGYNPTCITEGLKTHYICSLCNTNFNEDKERITSVIIPVNSNNHDYHVTNSVDSTCKDKGIVESTCSRCNNVAIKELEYADHSYGALVEKVEPTCQTPGIIAHYLCSVCDKTFNEEKVEVLDLSIPSADAHKFIVISTI